MFANLSGWHLLIILAVVLLLFGATRLPALSRSLGQSVRIFKSETKHLRAEDADAAAATETASAVIPTGALSTDGPSRSGV